MDDVCIPDKEIKGYKSEKDYRLLEEDGVISAEARVKEGDVVAIRQKSKEQLRIKSALDLAAQRSPIDWVSVDSGKLEGQFTRKPERTDLPPEINENLIVELYSK